MRHSDNICQAASQVCVPCAHLWVASTRVAACVCVWMWQCACLSLCVPSGIPLSGVQVGRQPDTVCTCLMAVRKPCGLKKPVIQKQLGRPSKIQAWNCRFRSSNSVNQNPRVLEAHDAWKTKTNSNMIKTLQCITENCHPHGSEETRKKNDGTRRNSIEGREMGRCSTAGRTFVNPRHWAFQVQFSTDAMFAGVSLEGVEIDSTVKYFLLLLPLF